MIKRDAPNFLLQTLSCLYYRGRFIGIYRRTIVERTPEIPFGTWLCWCYANQLRMNRTREKMTVKKSTIMFNGLASIYHYLFLKSFSYEPSLTIILPPQPPGSAKTAAELEPFGKVFAHKLTVWEPAVRFSKTA